MEWALKQMSALKSPRPDGFGAGFYKNHRGAVGKETCRAVIEFLNEGKMKNGINNTYIALIPKVKNCERI